MRFLRPDPLRLVLLAVFVAVAVGGAYEARGFSEEGSGGLFGAWTIWMALLAPLGLLFITLDLIGLKLDVFDRPVLFWSVQVVYFYLLASVIAAIVQMVWRRARRSAT